ncbi:hypothetical protein AU476_12705 [Cupriavidus sp. UYMSc13B]|nr:hypothetical protein AU476_12705 [Cupriavidus sp. UYMSc13B]
MKAMRIVFFVCDGVLHPARTGGVPPHLRGAPAGTILDAGYFAWTRDFADALADFHDAVLINECEWGKELEYNIFTQCLGPAARQFAGVLDSSLTARALLLEFACPRDWIRVLPCIDAREEEHVCPVDPLLGISSNDAKASLRERLSQPPL